MYLSKIHLHGFKSFAQKTDLLFDPGITAIVGPNGCGKSNIVDAVRWVLGEQRARLLRSEKMENVIFNGTARRRALGMSEVSLTIENTRNVLPTEYSEVTITRRLYRSGESEYLLNNVTCRLKDILDLFMDTGMGANAYSIIELKMVDDILSESAQDRRRLFEEAAGITKYKLRRTQALRKLDTTQADLTRIRDLTAEIEKHVRSLERQAKKASRYVELKARLEHFELGVARVEFIRHSGQQAAIRREIDQVTSHISRANNRLAGEEAALEAQRKQLLDAERLLTERQRELNAHIDRMRRHELDLQLHLERASSARSNLASARKEQEIASHRGTALETEIDRLTRACNAARPVLAAASSKAGEAARVRDETQKRVDQQRAELKEAREREQRAATAVAEHRNELNRLLSRLELIEAEIRRGSAQLEAVAEASKTLRERVADSAVLLQAAEKAEHEARRKLEKTAAERNAKQERLQDAVQALQTLHRRSDALDAELRLLESLIASYEEFSDSVRFLATTRTWTESAPQTVADLVSCSPADRTAIDAALGEYASCFVVGSEKEARAAISLLHSERKGQAAFFVLERLPLNGVYTNGELPPLDGARQAIDLVNVGSDQLRRLLSLLLRDCYVVDSFEDAKALANMTDPAKSTARFIARSGEWVYPHGLIYGGSRSEDAPSTAHRIERREQLDAARSEQRKVGAAIKKQSTVVEALKSEIESLDFDALQKLLADAERLLAEKRQEHHRNEFELESQEKRASEMGGRLEELRNDLGSGRSKTEELQHSLTDAEQTLGEVRKAVSEEESQLPEAERKSREALAAFSEANLAVVQARNELENLRRELERVTAELSQLDAREKERAEEIARLEQSISDSTEAAEHTRAFIDETAGGKDALDAAVSGAETEVLQQKAAISQTEASVREIRREREELMSQEGRLQTRSAETRARMEALEERLRNEYEMAPQDLPEIDPESFDEAEARQEIPSLRSRIRGLGAVNELALDDYEEEKERLAFMREQQEDLETAEDTLLSTIREINVTAAERFDATFEEIRKHFSSLFSQLFSEGDAEVFLTGERDPLESPIEIVARPRGKRPSTIAQLSGGEKTLTAIALLFAIYLVKPSPFCILDEVDAPLDDANIERFMRLIRNFAQSTQFVLVTHNKRTMEAADRMYGITMQDEGVSKVVGVKFDERIEAVVE